MKSLATLWATGSVLAVFTCLMGAADVSGDAPGFFLAVCNAFFMGAFFVFSAVAAFIAVLAVLSLIAAYIDGGDE